MTGDVTLEDYNDDVVSWEEIIDKYSGDGSHGVEGKVRAFCVMAAEEAQKGASDGPSEEEASLAAKNSVLGVLSDTLVEACLIAAHTGRTEEEVLAESIELEPVEESEV